MDKRVAQIEQSKQRIASMCTKLQWVFFALFVLYCITIIAVIAFSLFLPGDFEYVGPTSVLSLIPVACDVVAGGMSLLVISWMMKAASEGFTPFNATIARQFLILSIILLLSVFAELLITPGTVVGAINGNSAMAISYEGYPENALNVDLKNLIASIFCFALSVIFRYGAILQSETDDLM